MAVQPSQPEKQPSPQEPATRAEATHPPQITSAGEKWYNGIVYQGVNYWANLAVSLIAADYFTYGKGRLHLDKIITGTEKLLLKTGLSKAHSHRTAKSAWEVMALTCGGWMAALSTKVLEDNKRPIVHWLNDKMGVDQTAPDGHKLTPDEIYIEKEQPHQSWFNIIKRRLIASVAIIGAGHAIEYSIGKKELTDTIVSGVKKGMKSVGAGKIADNPTFGRYLGFAALDTIFTGMHAFTMSLTTGAKKAHMPKEVHEHAPEGVESRGEIVTAGKPASNFADRTPRREKRDAEQYKKPQNVPAPAESHTALASKDDGSLSLAL